MLYYYRINLILQHFLPRFYSRFFPFSMFLPAFFLAFLDSTYVHNRREPGREGAIIKLFVAESFAGRWIQMSFPCSSSRMQKRGAGGKRWNGEIATCDSSPDSCFASELFRLSFPLSFLFPTRFPSIFLRFSAPKLSKKLETHLHASLFFFPQGEFNFKSRFHLGTRFLLVPFGRTCFCAGWTTSSIILLGETRMIFHKSVLTVYASNYPVVSRRVLISLVYSNYLHLRYVYFSCSVSRNITTKFASVKLQGLPFYTPFLSVPTLYL